MAGANSRGERIAFGLFDKFHRFVRIRQASVAFVHFDVFLDAAQHAEFSFDADALGVRVIDNSLRDRDIFLEWLVARIDHDRAVKTRLDAIVARLLVAMIEMDGENSFRKNFLGRANYRLEHALVGIFPGAF